MSDWYHRKPDDKRPKWATAGDIVRKHLDQLLSQAHIYINGVRIPVIVDPDSKNVIRLVNPDGSIANEYVLYEATVEYHDPYPEPSE